VKPLTYIRLGELIAPAPVRRAGSDRLPILSMTMRQGLVDQTEKFKKRVASEDTSSYKVVRRDDLVVGFPIDEGVLSFQRKYSEAIVSPAYDIWKVPRQDQVHLPYLERFLRSERAISFYRSRMRGTTARRRNLPTEQFLALQIPLPSLEAQRRIAAILEHADDLRRRRREAYRLTAELPHAMYGDKFGDPVVNPLHYPRTTIGALGVQMEYGPRFYNEAYSEDGIRIVRITDLSETGELNFDAMPKLSVSGDDLKRHKSRPGELLFARTGATVGKLAIISPGDPICIPGAYFIRLRFPSEINPTFAWYTLRSRSLQEIICERSRQSAQQNFSGPGLRRLPFIVPPLTLQQAFSAAVAEVDKLKVHQRAHLTALDALFTSLQHRAFRGELFAVDGLDNAIPVTGHDTIRLSRS
jgi:type I restriction enzyme S subunit